ncbi:ABC transporter ATP-binding protein [Campylobacter sp. MIT 21-1685]|uniref:ABC transporter ATP-binding protein n=1 Tax=unclassified Campylobacter TaxID=2593542 RepID=UPI00224AC8C4|nr:MULTISPECIES: ABC transporter ATP-binding protein [unclassified Campylobacter]MCX2683088.1 ABC transporter ATP-binding protein [Campylobacter sp. MIT 21-1684]MCX2751370.1 ABC transporter ATP-binding protein [Campylobacter sp. MIT 21-1682]MCX2807569.1 ABC transporter ATP-binding protein [Campylobacter sp. MIT 21-1685]
MLKLENFTLFRSNICLADSIHLCFEKGKVYAILGPNGTGKSSLLQAIFGELSFSGILRFKGEDVCGMKKKIWKKKLAYMPQDNFVDLNLSALDLVLLGLMDNLGLYISDEQIMLATNMMEKLGILALAHRNISELSGGQRQMLLFASVLLKQPQILLLDEPVSALDMHYQCILLEQVRMQTKSRELLSILVLHDLSLACQFADELVLLYQGEIKAKGKPRKVITKELLKEIYAVQADIFYDDNSLPCVFVKGVSNHIKRRKNE